MFTTVATSVEALSGDAALAPVAAGARLAVLGEGRSAVNMADGRGRLWTLGVRGLPDGPGLWRLDLDDLTVLALSAGDVLETDAGCIRLGGLRIDLARARLWDPPRLAVSVDAARHALLRAAAGRPRLGGTPTNAVESAVSRMLAEGAERFCEAVATGSKALASSAAARLVGLGPGLTPSGDDFLAGFAFARYHLVGGPDWAVRAVLRAVESHPTTAVSRHVIRHAAGGRAAQPLHDLLDALDAGDVDGIGAAAAAVAALGHSSGTDLMGGIDAALEIQLKEEER